MFFDNATNRKAIDLFRRIAPSIVFTHSHCDYMLDHEQVHKLTRNATFSYPVPNASSIPLLPGSAIPWLYYCDPIEGMDPYTNGFVQPSLYVDISNEIGPKVDMLACHQSRREWLRAHHGMDEYIEFMKRCSAKRGYEIGVAYAEALSNILGMHIHRRTSCTNYSCDELFNQQRRSRAIVLINSPCFSA